jgi:triphosphoribosyl-dephospho-CoA synthase
VIRGLTPDEIVLFVQTACLFEVSAPKPGNVTRHHHFHDTRFEDFLLSAAAIGPAFGRALEKSVGETILRAVRDTRRVVHVNTNLGMILLLAPLARAAGQTSGTLRERVSGVLTALTVADARAVYEAIRLVAPGGLGKAEAQDVNQEPTLTLCEVMALAAPRDQVASEYATNFEVTFDCTLPALRRARGDGLAWPNAIVEAFLSVLATVPDTLIARKEGAAVARQVSAQAQQVLATGKAGSEERARASAAFDAFLRGPGNRLNPGTTADLLAAATFVALAEEL